MNQKLKIKKTAVPSDLLRTTIIIPSGDAVQSTLYAAKAIEAMGERGYELYTDPQTGKADVDNRFEDAQPGYKHVALKLVKEGDPVIRELQSIQPAMFEAKKELHGIYDEKKAVSKALLAIVDGGEREKLEQRIREMDDLMDERYAVAYQADVTSRDRAPSPVFNNAAPSSTIASSPGNGRPTPSSQKSIKSASDLLLVQAEMYLSAARLSSTDMAANFFSVAGNISNKSISPKEGKIAKNEATGASLVRNALDRLRKKQAEEADNEAFSDLDDLLKSVMPVEPPPLPDYEKFKPALEKVFSSIKGDTLQDRVNTLLEKLNERYSLEQLDRLEPQLAKFLDENILQSAPNESIEKIEDENATNTSQLERNGQNGDAGESSTNVQGVESGGNIGSSGKRKSDRSTRDIERTSQPGDEPSGDLEQPGDRPNPESIQSGSRGTRSGNRPSDRVPEREPRRDYVAPVGSLTREGSWKQAAVNNLDAIELAKKIESENRVATPEEQAKLAKFVGWGASELANNIFK